MNKVRNEDYTYAVSRIRAIEKKLLDDAKLSRMLDSRPADEALKILSEAEYGLNSDNINAFQYEKLLKEESKKLYALVRELMPQSDIVDVFLQANDFHNIKVILKAEFLGMDNFDDLLIDSGAINISNEFLTEYINTTIDIANIKIFLRLKKLNKSWDFLNKVLVGDGSINCGLFVKNMDSSLDNFLEAMRFTPYGSLLEKALESYKTTGSLTKFEMISDNYIMNMIKKAKLVTFGPEPLIGYLLAKETEIKNVRIIMVGKLNGILNESIKERLRDCYV